MSPTTDSVLEATKRRIRDHLEAFGQGHLLALWAKLNDVERAALLKQCDELPLQSLASAMADPDTLSPRAADLGTIEPAVVVAHTPPDGAAYRAKGELMIATGRVACFTVAGGQGTRLGWDAPKGTFPATPIEGKSLFQVFAESILASRRRYHGMVRWYIMTSPLNHLDTVRFFEAHSWFGLGSDTVRVFMQGTLPSLSRDGKILLSGPGTIALNPDGHGGAVRALAASGALAEMHTLGIDTLSYFQVDNPLVDAVDPLFLGLHEFHPQSSAEVSSKVVAKRDASEKVGVFCRRGKRTVVLEYTDLPRDLAEATRGDGGLVHWAGSIAIHVFSRTFLERLAGEGERLPLHRALKRVAHIDPASGVLVEPTHANAVKLEAFIFDAIPLAESPLVYETRRDEEFAPIKNATGEDSPETSRRAQSERAGRWLERCGVRIPRSKEDGTLEATIELSPLTALDAEALSHCPGLPCVVEAASSVLL
ncbi:MAG: UDPGP type 1 family protein [Phycisphaerales bacterium]|nr:UDPGP type 1 family protein [Phycisphaerales bacterium]